MITDTNYQELLWEEWQEKFRPIRNRIAKTEVGYDNTLFETYGEEYQYILKTLDTSPLQVWTLVTNDFGKDVIVEGWHWVNRMGYFVTEIPFTEGITYSVYWDEEDRDYGGEYKIAEEHHVAFCDWTYSQHGGHPDCEVADQLHNWRNNQGTLQDVLDALDETDDGWQESWETYLETYLNQRI